MSTLSSVVCKELHRYSEKMRQILASTDVRGSVQTTKDVTKVLSEPHALFEDGFLDRIIPTAGWIQPLLESSLIPNCALLINRIIQIYNHAKDKHLFSASAVEDYSIRRHVWAQLAAVEIGHAAMPIQWAIQALQVEAASIPAPKRLGTSLLEQLSAVAILQALSGAARFVHEEVWTDAHCTCRDSGELLSSGGYSTDATPAAASTGLSSRQRSSALRGILRRIDDHTASGCSCCHAGDTTAAANVGARVLSVVAQHLSAILAAHEEELQQDTAHDHSDTASAAAASDAAAPRRAVPLLSALQNSDVLNVLCSAVLTAPSGPLAFSSDGNSSGSGTHEYMATLADVQLTTCMVLWDLSALVAPYGSTVGELLASSDVLQMRRTALEQVASSEPWRPVQLREKPPRTMLSTNRGETSIGLRSISAAGRNSGGGSRCSGGSSSGGGSQPAVGSAWPLLQCRAVRRVYAARGLHLADVIHVVVDAAVGAITMAQKHGIHFAATAAEQLFPSRFAAADIAVRVCRALHAYAVDEPDVVTARGGAGSAWASPYTSAGGSSCKVSRGGDCNGGGDLRLQQRLQLSDDAMSVETALRIRMLGAPVDEMQACMPNVIGVRSWVQRLTAAADGGMAAAAAAAIAPTTAASSAGRVLLPLQFHQDSPRPSDLSSLSSPDGTTVYDHVISTRQTAVGHDPHSGREASRLRNSPASTHSGALSSGTSAGRRIPATTNNNSNTDPINAAAASNNLDNASASTESQAGSMTAPTISDSEPSVLESSSTSNKFKFKGSKVRGLARLVSRNVVEPLPGPLSSASPGHSPQRHQQRPSGGIRWSLDRLRRWVSGRWSHEGCTTVTAADQEAQIVVAGRAQAPHRGGDGGSERGLARGGGGGSKPQITLGAPPSVMEPPSHRHSHTPGQSHNSCNSNRRSGACNRHNVSRSDGSQELHHHHHHRRDSSMPSLPPLSPSQQHPQHYRQLRPNPMTPPRAQPPRHATSPIAAAAAAAPFIGTPPRPKDSSASMAAASRTSPVVATLATTSPAFDIVARVPVVHSPDVGRNVDVYGKPYSSGGRCYSGGGIGRYSSHGATTSAEATASAMGLNLLREGMGNGGDSGSQGVKLPVVVVVDVVAETEDCSGGGDYGHGSGSGSGCSTAVVDDKKKEKDVAVAVVAAAAVPSRRSVLRSGVLAVPLRLLRRRQPRPVTEESEDEAVQ